jgi:hypothetical protein
LAPLRSKLIHRFGEPEVKHRKTARLGRRRRDLHGLVDVEPFGAVIRFFSAISAARAMKQNAWCAGTSFDRVTLAKVGSKPYLTGDLGSKHGPKGATFLGPGR